MQKTMKKTMKKTTEKTTEKTTLKVVVAQSIALARNEGAVLRDIVTLFQAMLRMSPSDVIDYAVELVVALNKIHDIGATGLSNLHANAWNTDSTRPMATRSIYNVYLVARRMADKDLRYMARGATEKWHIEDLFGGILSSRPAKWAKDAKYPTIAQALQRLNAVLHTKAAKVECADKGWASTEAVYRGLDGPRLRDVIYYGQYTVPEEENKKAGTVESALKAFEIWVKKYMVPEDHDLFSRFTLLGCYLIQGHLTQISDNIGSMLKLAGYDERPTAVELSEPLVPILERLKQELPVPVPVPVPVPAVKRVKTLAETDAKRDMLQES